MTDQKLWAVMDIDDGEIVLSSLAKSRKEALGKLPWHYWETGNYRAVRVRVVIDEDTATTHHKAVKEGR